MAEANWTELFRLEVVSRQELERGDGEKVPRECCEACLMAHEIKCVCRCGGRNHGAWLRRNVKPLDDYNGDEAREDAKIEALLREARETALQERRLEAE